jgi:hypothetical protein
MWDQCRVALNFFEDNKIPFWEMTNDDQLLSVEDGYCFTKKGEIYLVYLKNGGETKLDLGGIQGSFTVSWVNPRSGGTLITAPDISGGSQGTLSAPDNENDWLALVSNR